MTTKELSAACGFAPAVEAETREIAGIFTGDLLSWAMGRAKEGDAWFTVMGNVNAVAVAALADCACIVLCHGAALDAVGGVAVMAALGAKHMAEPWQQRVERFGRIGTIDLRVDYMRPGIGQRFVVRAEVLRLGSRVATTRMEFLSETGELLSAGMAAYIVS